MPNHVSNTITFTAKTKEELQKVLDEVFGMVTDGYNEKPYFGIDFNKIVPEDHSDPKYQCTGVTVDEHGRVSCNESITLDDASDPFNWYQYHYDKWGTKWNAYDQFVEDIDDCRWDADTDGYYFTASFNTAWSFPKPIVEALVKRYPNIKFEIYATEEAEFFRLYGTGENGKLDLTIIDPSEVIFTEDRKRAALENYFREELKLDPEGYNIDKILDDDVVYFESTEDDAEHKFANPVVEVTDASELEADLDSYKKKKKRRTKKAVKTEN